MEKDVLTDLKMSDRDSVVKFLKRLWNSEPTACPLCGSMLDYMHKKAKKSDCDWKCTGCGKLYKTIDILDRLNEK